MRFPRRFLLLMAAALCTCAEAGATTYYWDGANTTADADGGSGTWSASESVTSYSGSYYVRTSLFGGYYVYYTDYYASWSTSPGGWNTAATAGSVVNWESGSAGPYRDNYNAAYNALGPGLSAWHDAVFGGTGGAVSLSGTHLYANSLTFDAAGYSLNSGSSVLNTGSITANASATINTALGLYYSPTWSVAADQTLSVAKSVSSGSGTQSLTVSGAGDTVVTGNISSIGLLSKQGAGRLALYGSNNLGNGVNLVSGVLELGSSGALGSSGTINLLGGTLRHTTGNATDYSGRFSTAANQNYNIDTNGRDITWAANLTSVGGSLHKSGAGTLTLTGANTYTGSTTITGGSLVINGSLSAAISVSSGGTLSGNGTFGGVTVGSGGTLSPGNSPGKQTFTGNLVLSGGSALLMQIYSDTAVYASGPLAGLRGYDTIQVDGAALDLSNASVTNKITLFLMTLTNWSDSSAGVPTLGNLTFEKATSGPYPWVPKEFAVATYLGPAILSEGQTLSDVFAIDTTGFFYETGPNAKDYWAVTSHPWGDCFWLTEKDIGGGMYQLTLSVIPEPSTYGLMLGGLALAAAALRRRKVSK